MEFTQALSYVGGFILIWLAVLFLAAILDRLLRRFFKVKFFPDDYWKPTSGSTMTHCTKCNVILIDRDYCRNCGEVNI